jgi:3-oxoacyl-[acyl-carrier protein] reductase
MAGAPAGGSPLVLPGYRVVVAGGSRGIGRGIALAFARAGAAVSICARGEDALADVASDIRALGAVAHMHPCDLGNAADIDAYIAAAAAALGGIDVLVNNASGYGFSDDDAGWTAGFNIDLMAAVRASRAALPYLKTSGHGSVIHTSSIAALRPRASGAPYAAIKAALSHYTSSQALEWAAHGIRVNAIAPGSISFPDGLWERRKRDEPDLYAATLARIPFGRFGTPEDIAPVAVFLASPWAGWITGQTLAVDGGQMLGG